MHIKVKQAILVSLVGPFALVMAIPFLCVKGYELAEAVFAKLIDKLEEM